LVINKNYEQKDLHTLVLCILVYVINSSEEYVTSLDRLSVVKTKAVFSRNIGIASHHRIRQS